MGKDKDALEEILKTENKRSRPCLLLLLLFKLHCAREQNGFFLADGEDPALDAGAPFFAVGKLELALAGLDVGNERDMPRHHGDVTARCA